MQLSYAPQFKITLVVERKQSKPTGKQNIFVTAMILLSGGLDMPFAHLPQAQVPGT